MTARPLEVRLGEPFRTGSISEIFATRGPWDILTCARCGHPDLQTTGPLVVTPFGARWTLACAVGHRFEFYVTVDEGRVTLGVNA
jgi:hypothetical protein